MQQTRAAHMDAGFSQEGRFRFDSKALAWEVTPSGNGVNLEQEMLKATETTAAYALVSNVYKTSQSMLKQALGGR